MGHIEYIERLIKERQKTFLADSVKGLEDEKEIETFRKGYILGMKYIIYALKNPVDFEEEGE